MKEDSLLGQQLDEYRLEQLLGHGGMARVYRAVDVNLNRYAAIKVIDTPFRAESEYINRFKKEAQAIAGLNHPHIVTLYRYGESQNVLYMAMEYIEGADLEKIMQGYQADKEEFPPDELIRIIKEVGSALDYAHGKGVIHRDIKPSNIMLASDGRAILTDFGLVLMTELGTHGDIFGSPHYIAPEQAISSAGAVPQSDLYAVGVILYELFTGKLPFDAENPMDIAMKHMTEDPPPPSSLNPDINPAVEKLILKMLDKTPDERYASGAELAGALEAALKATSASPSGSRHSVLDRVSIFMEENPLDRLEELEPAQADAPAVAPVPKPPSRLPEMPVSPPSVAQSAEATPAKSTAFSKRTSEMLRASTPPAPEVPPSAPTQVASGKKNSLSLYAVLAGVALIIFILVAIIGVLLMSDGEEDSEKDTDQVAVVTEALEATEAVETPVTKESPAENIAVSPTQVISSTPMILPSITFTATFTLSPTFTFSPAPTFTATSLPPSETATHTAIPSLTLTPLPTNTHTPESEVADSTVPITASAKIAFVSNREGNYEIYIMNSDGTELLNLSNNPASDEFPTWSPDGRLAFASNRNGDYELYIINADGSGIRQLTSNPDADDKAPAWSPDGQWIVFASDRSGEWELYIIHPDGSGIQRITTDSLNKSDPAWFPDSQRIVYWAEVSRNNKEIFMTDISGTAPERLTSNRVDDGWPRPSPNGNVIAFDSHRDGNWEVYFMLVNGTNQTNLSKNSAADGRPSWTPDGRILFSSNRDGNNDGLYIMNANGTNPQMLLDTGFDDFSPVWQPLPITGNAVAPSSDTSAPVESPASYRLTLKKEGDYFFIRNISGGDFPYLEKLFFDGENGDFDGEVWADLSLADGECVSIQKVKNNTQDKLAEQAAKVNCSEVIGQPIQVPDGSHFWKHDFTVFYDGAELQTCNKNGCELNFSD